MRFFLLLNYAREMIFRQSLMHGFIAGPYVFRTIIYNNSKFSLKYIYRLMWCDVCSRYYLISLTFYYLNLKFLFLFRFVCIQTFTDVSADVTVIWNQHVIHCRHIKVLGAREIWFKLPKVGQRLYGTMSMWRK